MWRQKGLSSQVVSVGQRRNSSRGLAQYKGIQGEHSQPALCMCRSASAANPHLCPAQAQIHMNIHTPAIGSTTTTPITASHRPAYPSHTPPIQRIMSSTAAAAAAAAAASTPPPPPQTVQAGNIPLARLRCLWDTSDGPAAHAVNGYPPVKKLSPLRKKRILVTGVGSPSSLSPLPLQRKGCRC